MKTEAMVQGKTSAGRQHWLKRCGKAALFLCIVLGATDGLRAQGVRYDNIVLGPRGTPVGAATIAVCSAGASISTTPCSPLANIYADEALTQPVANPFQADSLGNYGFWAAPGHYVVQIYGAGVTTKTMDVFLPCDPSNCSMSSATFSTLTAGTINLTGALTVNGRNVSTEPKAGDAVMYVSPNGNDSADGQSWGSAKQTLYAAVSALMANAGGGTVYVAANTSCGGPTGQLLLYRAISSPGVGWIQTGALNVIGVGTNSWAAASPGPQVSLSCGSASLPALELNGVNTSVRFRNLIFTGSEGATITDSSTVTFDNVSFVVNSSSATNGPAVFIGPASFEIYFRHCDFQANTNSGEALNGSDATEAFVVNPGPGGAPGNLIYVDQSIEESGDLKFYTDGIAWGNGLQVNGLLMENGRDTHGAVWFPAGMTGYGNAVIANVQVADSTTGTPAVGNDNALGADEILVEGAVGGGGPGVANVVGPATVLSQYQPNFQNLTAIPFVSGQPGPIYGHSFLNNDEGRRFFPPAASSFSNIVSPVTAGTNGWYTNGSGVTLTAAAAPDGTNNAIKAVNANTYAAGAATGGNSMNLASGDYLIWGVWESGAEATQVGIGPAVSGQSCSGVTLTSLTPTLGATFPGLGWQWVSGTDKVSGSNSSCTFNLMVLAPASSTVYAFAPVYYHVAAGTISDSDAAYLALNLGSYPAGISPPVEATLPGHPFAFGGSGDNYFATLDHTALTANETYTFPNASGTVCVAGAGTVGCGSSVADTTTTVGTTAITANSCTASTTVTMNGVTTSMTFSFTPTTDISGVTGWGSTGGLVIDAWPTANTLDYKVCNQTASSITPSASVTFNVSAR